MANRAKSASLWAFVSLYRSAVVARLVFVWAARAKMDRFLVLSLEPRAPGQDYVQCLFTLDNPDVLCEAASGYYSVLDGEPRVHDLAPEAVAILVKLGFLPDDSDCNFQRLFTVHGLADLDALAEFLLTALHEGFGARVGNAIFTTAPFDIRASAACGRLRKLCSAAAGSHPGRRRSGACG